MVLSEIVHTIFVAVTFSEKNLTISAMQENEKRYTKTTFSFYFMETGKNLCSRKHGMGSSKEGKLRMTKKTLVAPTTT